jgi:integrase/recombinase XerD
MEIHMKCESKVTATSLPRSSELGDLITAYLSDLASQGYMAKTLAIYRCSLRRFEDYAIRRGAGHHELRGLIRPFVRAIKTRGHGPQGWRSVLGRFVKWLQSRNLAGTRPQVPLLTSDGKLVEQYIQFQLEHRGVCAEYAKELRRVCAAFLDSARGKPGPPRRPIRPESIARFVTSLGRRCSRVTMSSRCYVLRGFLRFLYRRGHIAQDLSPLVLVPRRFHHEDCPRFVGPDSVRKVLAQVDRSKPVGRRNYAMIMLLTVYGLRGIEVIRLRFEDIDWETATIRIPSRKAGNTTAYPLAASVGKAILAYLRDGRPPSRDRHVFLSAKAPFRHMVYTCIIGRPLREYMQKAGISVARPGTHTFRYSCAQRLLDAGTPLKSIGDYLGHRNSDSTGRYLKIAIEQLREVAQGDGEDIL